MKSDPFISIDSIQIYHPNLIKPILSPTSIIKQQNKFKTFKSISHKTHFQHNSYLVDQYFQTNKFQPRLPSRQLVNQPKFLFSIQRRKQRIKTQSSCLPQYKNQTPKQNYSDHFFLSKSKNINKSNIQRQKQDKQLKKPFLKSKKKKLLLPKRIYLIASINWDQSPHNKIKKVKGQTPKFLFNLHHMMQQYQDSVKEQNSFKNIKFPKGYGTKYYGSHLNKTQRFKIVKNNSNMIRDYVGEMNKTTMNENYMKEQSNKIQ